MITTIKSARMSSASARPDPTNKQDSVGDLNHHQTQAPPPRLSEPKTVRLKLTKPRLPRSNPKDVDWDEDLRPTPNEILAKKETHQGSSIVDKAPSQSDKMNNKTGDKRVITTKTQKASSKRRKSNTRKSMTAREISNIGPQLPLTKVNASTMSEAPPGKNVLFEIGDLNEQSREDVTKIDEHVPEDSHQPAPPINGKDKNEEEGGTDTAFFVERRSCTSVTTDSTSDLEDHGKGSFGDSKVNILEHRAQSNRQATKDKAAHTITDVSPISDFDFSALSRNLTESKTPPKGRESKGKAVREPDHPEYHGRAKSVGSKLMLALHRTDNASSLKLVNKDTKPPVISSDSGRPGAILKKQPFDQVATKTVSVQEPHSQVHVEMINPALIESALPHNMERMKLTHGMEFWRSLDQTEIRSRQSSSEIEIGRGLTYDGPSILDYHMGMEHVSGFSALQPMRSGPNTSSHVTNICDSQANTSETSNKAHFEEFTTLQSQGRGFSQTPDSQKPLLANETLMKLDSHSPHPPKSMPKTSIVDRNGSPRLGPQLVKSMADPQLEVDEDKIDRKATGVAENSPGEYDRGSSDASTESGSGEITCTKFQRDILLEYGIDTEKLQRSQWPPHSRQRLSFSQENTADGANSEKASTIGSTSSQQMINERSLGDVTSKTHGNVDQSIHTEMLGSTQAQDRSYHTTGDHDTMEWISTLQVAQNEAHNMLKQTNSVSRRCLNQCDYTNWDLASVNPVDGRKGHHQSRPADLPRRVRSDPRRSVPGARSTYAALSAANTGCQGPACRHLS